jgi:hypothetical protein
MPTTGSLTDFAEAQILNHLFGGVPWAISPSLFFGYMVGTSGETVAGAEPNAGGYARVAVENTAENFPVVSNQIKTNAKEILFSRATANHGLVQGVGVWDSPAAGNQIAYCPLAQPIVIEENDAFRIPPGAFTLQFTAGGLSNYAKNAVLNHVFGGVPFSLVATLFAGYMLSTPTDAAAGAEPTGGNYARSAIPNTTYSFPAITGGGTKLLVRDVVFAEASADQGITTHVGFWDASAGGNYLGSYLIGGANPRGMGITVGMIPYLPANTVSFWVD